MICGERNLKKKKESYRATYFKRSAKAMDNAPNHEQPIIADPHALVHPVHALQQRAVHIQRKTLGRDANGYMVPLSIRQIANWEPNRETHGSLCNHMCLALWSLS